jgi:hypothetical protein
MLIKELKAKTIQQIWKEELNELSLTWESYRKDMESYYEHGKEPTKAMKAAPTKAPKAVAKVPKAKK